MLLELRKGTTTAAHGGECEAVITMPSTGAEMLGLVVVQTAGDSTNFDLSIVTNDTDATEEALSLVYGGSALHTPLRVRDTGITLPIVVGSTLFCFITTHGGATGGNTYEIRILVRPDRAAQTDQGTQV